MNRNGYIHIPCKLSDNLTARTWADDVAALRKAEADNTALRERVTELEAALEEARKDFDRICHNCALPQDQDLYFLADSGRDSVEQALAALTQEAQS